MPLDPTLTLALALHTKPAAYAFLLGSGISRAAGIPTAPGIVDDLIRQLAAMEGQSAACDPDPAGWYRTWHRMEPEYAALLDAVAPTAPERQRVLAEYFEPLPADGEPAPRNTGDSGGDRRPTAAHRAIAALAAGGHVKVILTTNFDTLLERALTAADVPHTVLSTADAVEGAVPLVHAGVTIIKLHGDYRDPRILNTPSELRRYDPRTRALLARVLDEYGLLVCGWSGESDTALRSAILRTKSRRFTTYWAVRGEPGTAATRLIAARDAYVIQIPDADGFFTDLADKVRALGELDAPHPVAAPVAAAMLKRYLADATGRIRAHDLVLGAADAVRAAGVEDQQRRLVGLHDSTDAVRTHLQRLDARAAPLVALMSVGCYWGTPAHDELWPKALGRASDLADDLVPHGPGETTWNNLRFYPAALALYAGGLAAAAAGRWKVVAEMFALSVRRYTLFGTTLPAVWQLNLRSVMLADTADRVLFGTNLLAPLSEHVYRLLRVPLRDLFADAAAYEPAFDRFEYLIALAYADVWFQAGEETVRYVPRGRFRRGQVADLIDAEIDAAGSAWPPLAGGLFAGDPGRLSRARAVIRQREHAPREL